MTRVISLELNEINFDFVRRFIAEGEALPNFRKLIEAHGVIETVSESGHPNLEPWIQWPTFYTGMTYAEHGIFRLGDAVKHDHKQIWEYLEERGKTVAAISPINAANRCSDPAFFLPDPWTDTPITASPSVARLYALVKALVNDNASEQSSVLSLILRTLPVAGRYASLASAPEYFRALWHARAHKWARAAILDRLLADLFLILWGKHKPDYASLFLNAGAHIQHHYMYESRIYEGEKRNPEWYAGTTGGSQDPLLFIYQTYDDIVGDFMRTGDVRLLISTGLSQLPNEREIYQYRMISHADTLAKLGLANAKVEPRMSRDFLLNFASADEASSAERLLRTYTIQERPLFTIENRSDSLFCQVGYYGPPESFADVSGGAEHFDLSGDVVLVSIENGIHQTKGFHIDSGMSATAASQQPAAPLATLFGKIVDIVCDDAQTMKVA